MIFGSYGVDIDVHLQIPSSEHVSDKPLQYTEMFQLSIV